VISVTELRSAGNLQVGNLETQAMLRCIPAKTREDERLAFPSYFTTFTRTIGDILRSRQCTVTAFDASPGPLPNNRLTTQPALGWVGDLRSGGAENARNNALVGALYVTYFLVVRVDLFPLAGIS
jgi:hypothetical protein